MVDRNPGTGKPGTTVSTKTVNFTDISGSLWQRYKAYDKSGDSFAAYVAGYLAAHHDAGTVLSNVPAWALNPNLPVPTPGSMPPSPWPADLGSAMSVAEGTVKKSTADGKVYVVNDVGQWVVKK